MLGWGLEGGESAWGAGSESASGIQDRGAQRSDWSVMTDKWRTVRALTLHDRLESSHGEQVLCDACVSMAVTSLTKSGSLHLCLCEAGNSQPSVGRWLQCKGDLLSVSCSGVGVTLGWSVPMVNT